MVWPSAHLTPDGISIIVDHPPDAHCWYEVPPTQLNMPSLEQRPVRPPEGPDEPVLGGVDAVGGATTAAAELDVATAAAEVEATGAIVGLTLVTNPEEAAGGAVAAEVGAGAALLAAGGEPLPASPLPPEPEPPFSVAPLGTQPVPSTLAKLLDKPGLMTLDPGLGNSGSVEGVVLQELISARLATNSSGSSSRVATTRVSFPSDLFDFPPVTVIGAQFM